jgi:hypothetical protein
LYTSSCTNTIRQDEAELGQLLDQDREHNDSESKAKEARCMVIAARVQGLLLNLEYNHKVCSDVLDRLHSPSMSQRDQELNVHHLNCICESMGVQQFEFEALLPKIDEKIRLTQNVSAAYTPQGSFNQPQSPPAPVQQQFVLPAPSHAAEETRRGASFADQNSSQWQ